MPIKKALLAAMLASAPAALLPAQAAGPIAAMPATPGQGRAAALRFDDVARIVHADAKAAFAGRRADTYVPDASLAETVRMFIGIPGNGSPASFGPYAMIDGCRHHSCIEKAAVIVDMRSREIAAVALRNHACRRIGVDASGIAAPAGSAGTRPAVRCKDEPVLDLYVVRRAGAPAGAPDEREQLARLRQWGATVGHQGERVQIVERRLSQPGQ